jgi:hypothetical protein
VREAVHILVELDVSPVVPILADDAFIAAR